MELVPGMEAQLTVTVTEDMCARVVGSGSLDVLATPMLIAFMEKAACQAIAPALGDGETSVGTRMNMDHLAPTPVGATVTVQARLTARDRRALTFSVEASDEAGCIGRGEHNRFLVQAGPFMEKASARKTSA